MARIVAVVALLLLAACGSVAMRVVPKQKGSATGESTSAVQTGSKDVYPLDDSQKGDNGDGGRFLFPPLLPPITITDPPGPAGPPGPPGVNGTNGAPGLQGPPGKNGKDGTPGAQGPPGINGTDGTPGAQGPPGADGKDGTPGAQGPPGINGTDGTPGARGPAGFNGTDGAPGARGPAGFNGTDGAPGARGPAGFNGTDGAPGARGPAGPAGPGACSTGRSYVVKSINPETAITACETVFPTGAAAGSYKCAIAKCERGEAFLTGGCNSNVLTNPVLGSSPLCADNQGNLISCPSIAANVVGWACASSATTTYLRASALCCGEGKKDRVLIAAATSVDTYRSDVKAVLDATGAFGQVDTFDAGSATPTLQQLGQYDAVLTFTDASRRARPPPGQPRGVGFSNPSAFGNILADYWDGGGRVVVAVWANAVSSDFTNTALTGRWSSGNYALINPAADATARETSIQIADPTNPLVRNVTTLRAQFAVRSTGQVINNGVVVARWGNSTGAPLIVSGVKNGRNLVALNFFPPSSTVDGRFWVGDGAAILRNALLY